MAKSEVFKYPILGKLFKHYNVFPVDRNKTDSKSLFHSINIFKQPGNQELLIFPEGKVIKNESEIGKIAKKGVVFISANCNVPIVPVYISTIASTNFLRNMAKALEKKKSSSTTVE